MKQKINLYLVSFFLALVVLFTVFYDKIQTFVTARGFDGDIVKWLLVVLILPLLKTIATQFMELMTYQRQLFEKSVQITLTETKSDISKEVSELGVSVDKRFDQVDRRLNSIDSWQGSADQKFKTIEEKLALQEETRCGKETRSKDYDSIWENAKPYFDSFHAPEINKFARLFKESFKTFAMEVTAYNLKDGSVISLMEKLRNEMEFTFRFGEQILSDSAVVMLFEKAIVKHIDHYEIGVHNTLSGKTNDRIRSLHTINQTFLKDSLDCLFETYQRHAMSKNDHVQLTSIADEVH